MATNPQQKRRKDFHIQSSFEKNTMPTPIARIPDKIEKTDQSFDILKIMHTLFL